MNIKRFLQTTPQDFAESLHQTNIDLEERETQKKASANSIPYIMIRHFPIDLRTLSMWTEEESRQNEAIVFFKEEKELKIACTNPHNTFLQNVLQNLSKTYHITLHLASKSGIASVSRLYLKIPKNNHTDSNTPIVKSALSILEIAPKYTNKPEVNISELLSDILSASMTIDSSDIHLEATSKKLKIRFRIDGILQDILDIEKDASNKLVNRIKQLSKLKININNLPQDGRFTFIYFDKQIDVRVSLLPSAYGENFVLRLLGVGLLAPDLNNLSLHPIHLKILLENIEKPNGMIINTGPTGSGKTTTLYSCLKELNKPGVKIITLEDPIEYKIEGIQQTPIDHSHDFSFEKGLRSILRQDPDVIMVGEIRDEETASAAVQASLTGHLVLTTLHTNDATGTFSRLYNMGIEAFNLSDSLNVVMAQRLVRKLCDNCKQKAILSPETLEKVLLTMQNTPRSFNMPKENYHFYNPVGCNKCNNIGFKGRLGIYEIIDIDNDIKNLINKEATSVQLKEALKTKNFITMAQDGIIKAASGLTDLTEVFRITGI